MVNTFVEGINPGYERTITGFLDKMFQEMPALIANSIAVMNEAEKQDLVAKLNVVGKNILKDYVDKTRLHKTQRHVKPIIDTVAVLPKEELAAMAESLVNLTSFKRKVSLEAETVGGPIDVAVISKGDGFIWVKRKHYFKPELNPYFFSNYYRTHNKSDNQ
jgi:hypothetical protein